VSIDESTDSHPSDERANKPTDQMPPRELAHEFGRILDKREQEREQEEKESV
jgi:hypothetical protein